jgi:Tfp pilus assembly protein PilZ
MKDKRRYKRFTLNIQEINGKMLFATQVKVIDISIGGISIKANRRLNIGSEYALTLEGKNAISLRGSVVWSSLGEGRGKADGEVVPIYSAGLKFTNMSASKITELLSFIECYKKEEVHVIGGTRLNLRFRINDPEKVILNFPASYIVKKIGLGGMLIECVRDLEIESRIPMELSINAENPVEFVGRVASCQVIDKDSQKQYGIGIEFMDLTEKDKAVLLSFIQQSAVIEDGNDAGTASG